MFRRLHDVEGKPVTFTVDGRPAAARAGDSVAAALLANGVEVCRTTPVSGAARGSCLASAKEEVVEPVETV